MVALKVGRGSAPCDDRLVALDLEALDLRRHATRQGPVAAPDEDLHGTWRVSLTKPLALASTL